MSPIPLGSTHTSKSAEVPTWIPSAGATCTIDMVTPAVPACTSAAVITMARVATSDTVTGNESYVDFSPLRILLGTSASFPMGQVVEMS